MGARAFVCSSLSLRDGRGEGEDKGGVCCPFALHSQTDTHTCELQGAKATNPLARTPAVREAVGETGKKR